MKKALLATAAQALEAISRQQDDGLR